MNLIENLIAQGWLKTPKIIEAFRRIKRVDFLPEEMKDLAELNEALPIGYGQTISQPLVVAFMIEQLQPQPGDKILDIGSGSGWTTALLAYIVSSPGNPKSEILNPKQIQNSKFKIQKGKIIAIEVIPELKEFGEKNVAKYNFLEKGIVEFILSDGSKGYKKEAPFDKILASASAENLPLCWKEQLKIGGQIVTPIGSSIWLFIKKSATEFEEIEYPGFVFVPLITK
jgi:protein-L-isoaspartate(D-aspartate) O-methyltransferase